MNQSRLWTIGAVILIIGLLAGTWFLGVAPRLSDARDADVALTQAVTLNNVHRQTLVALQADHERLDEIIAELDEAHSVIPEGPEPPSLLKNIDDIALSNGVTVVNVSFQSPAPYIAPDEAPDEFLTAANELIAAGLYVIPVSFEVEGSEAGLLGFISALQSNQRYFHVFQGAVLSEDGRGTLTVQAELFGISQSIVSDAEAPAAP